MNITLFNKKYWVRRFKEPQNIRGYITADHEDFVASLHIHPMGSDAMLALPEGERKMKHLEGHGTDVLIPASEATGIKGDLLYYMGDWYECTAAQPWDHTVLSHLNYQTAHGLRTSKTRRRMTQQQRGRPSRRSHPLRISPLRPQTPSAWCASRTIPGW